MENTADIPDPMFAQEAVGRTVAVWPSDDNVFAPIAGTITAGMPHAFGIMGDNGVEILVHVGVDTVNMKGDGFVVWAERGSRVGAGDPQLTFDRDKVARARYKDIVMTIVTNSDELSGLEVVAEGEVVAGSALMRG